MKRTIITFVLAVSILTACQNAITSTQEEEMSEEWLSTRTFMIASLAMIHMMRISLYATL